MASPMVAPVALPAAAPAGAPGIAGAGPVPVAVAQQGTGASPAQVCFFVL